MLSRLIVFSVRQSSIVLVTAGLVLLPLMIYHALQLVVGGILAPRWASAALEKANAQASRG